MTQLLLVYFLCIVAVSLDIILYSMYNLFMAFKIIKNITLSCFSWFLRYNLTAKFSQFSAPLLNFANGYHHHNQAIEQPHCYQNFPHQPFKSACLSTVATDVFFCSSRKHYFNDCLISRVDMPCFSEWFCSLKHLVDFFFIISDAMMNTFCAHNSFRILNNFLTMELQKWDWCMRDYESF